jgi:hypothetical protein
MTAWKRPFAQHQTTPRVKLDFAFTASRIEDPDPFIESIATRDSYVAYLVSQSLRRSIYLGATGFPYGFPCYVVVLL